MLRRHIIDAIFTPPLERTLQSLNGRIRRIPFRSTQIPFIISNDYKQQLPRRSHKQRYPYRNMQSLDYKTKHGPPKY
jgi:hypothetical protein